MTATDREILKDLHAYESMLRKLVTAHMLPPPDIAQRPALAAELAASNERLMSAAIDEARALLDGPGWVTRTLQGLKHAKVDG